jgi:hypothetical protein
MANPYSPLNGQNQSLGYILPDSGGNSGGPSGNGGYIPRGKGAYSPTGAGDKTANTAVETHADGDTFASDPIEIVVAGVTAGGATKAVAIGTDGTIQAADPNVSYPAYGSLADGVAGNTTTNQDGAFSSVFNGSQWDRQRTPHVFKSFSGTVITSETTIWTPTSGKKFRLMGFVITQGVATGNITLKDNTAGTTILVIPATPTGQPLPFAMGNGILSAAANNVLTATGTSTETISGFVYGTEE